MKKTLLSVALAAGIAAPAVQAEQSNFSFDNGSVIMVCDAPDGGAQFSTENFEQMFPKWMTKMQEFADAGKVLRAHYLTELRRGIFVVFAGSSMEEQHQNAQELMAYNYSVLAEGGVTEEAINGSCELHEIGPVAILPR